MAMSTSAERAIVVKGSVSYTLGDTDAQCVFEEGGRQLFLGSEAASRSTNGLTRIHATSIVNCAGNSTPLPLSDRGACGVVYYKQLDFVDRAVVEGQNNLALIEAGADAIKEAFSSVTEGNVLVHCVAGVSRSSSVILAYLVKHKGYTLAEAAMQVKLARPVAYPNVGFWAALRELELRVKGECTISEDALKSHLSGDYTLSTHVFGEAERS